MHTTLKKVSTLAAFCLISQAKSEIETLSISSSASSKETGPPKELLANTTLILEDRFDRSEADDSKEQIGKQWSTNSVKRAKGVKQADLKNNALEITMADVADHAVSVKHDIPFVDGLLHIKFKLHDKKGVKFNFNDPKCRDVAWAGHVAGIKVTPEAVQLEDHRDGVFSLKLRKMKEDKAPKKEQRKFLEGRIKKLTHATALNEWHDAMIHIKGDTLTFYLNAKKVGSLTSSGIGHEPKQNIAFSVPGKVTIDTISVWKYNTTANKKEK